MLNQTYQDKEYLIVDGGSRDGTIDCIAPYRERLASLTSEPDKGIYDAMNKGIKKATGDVIGFLHADDFYADNDVLSQVAEAFADPAVDACYGDLVYVAADDKQKIVRTWKSGSFNRDKMYLGWMPPHPTFFLRRSFYQKCGGYRNDMGTSADYELMLRYVLCHRIRMVYIPNVLVCMRTGGASNASFSGRIKAHAMDWKAWFVNGLTPRPWTLPLKPLSKLSQWYQKGR